MSLPQIAPELILLIASHTDMKTLENLCLLNSQTRDLLTPLLYKSCVVFCPNQLQPFCDSINHCRSLGALFKFLYFTDAMFSNMTSVPVFDFRRALQAMPNLRALEYTEGCSGLDSAFDQSGTSYGESNAPFAITDLTAPDFSTRSLLSLFKTQTSITSLTLTSPLSPMLGTTSLQNQIDPSFLPQLTRLEADVIPCIELVPGRPLTHVNVVQPIFAPALTKDELGALTSALAQTSARMVSVEFSPQVSRPDFSGWGFVQYLGNTSVSTYLERLVLHDSALVRVLNSLLFRATPS
jgi:hypothetical protein